MRDGRSTAVRHRRRAGAKISSVRHWRAWPSVRKSCSRHRAVQPIHSVGIVPRWNGRCGLIQRQMERRFRLPSARGATAARRNRCAGLVDERRLIAAGRRTHRINDTAESKISLLPYGRRPRPRLEAVSCYQTLLFQHGDRLGTGIRWVEQTRDLVRPQRVASFSHLQYAAQGLKKQPPAVPSWKSPHINAIPPPGLLTIYPSPSNRKTNRYIDPIWCSEKCSVGSSAQRSAERAPSLAKSAPQAAQTDMIS